MNHSGWVCISVLKRRTPYRISKAAEGILNLPAMRGTSAAPPITVNIMKS
jgi:hypothetical protein